MTSKPKSYVQYVPGHCDRIVWRGSYYMLPLPSAPSPVEQPATPKQITEEVEAGIGFRHSLVEQAADKLVAARDMAYLSHLDRADLLAEVERLRPMAESWESYEAAQDRKAEMRLADETSAPKPCRVCSRHHEPPECSLAWLVEDGASPPHYRTADTNGFGWTLDVHKAIRLARRCDAEMLAAADDAAWKIVEHMWCSSPVEPTDRIAANMRVAPDADCAGTACTLLRQMRSEKNTENRGSPAAPGGVGVIDLAARSPDQLCKRCRHSYGQHTKGSVQADYCRHCACPAFVPYSSEKASEPRCGCVTSTDEWGRVWQRWCGKHWSERVTVNGTGDV